MTGSGFMKGYLMSKKPGLIRIKIYIYNIRSALYLNNTPFYAKYVSYFHTMIRKVCFKVLSDRHVRIEITGFNLSYPYPIARGYYIRIFGLNDMYFYLDRF